MKVFGQGNHLTRLLTGLVDRTTEEQMQKNAL
jgi:hypothetical protein